MHDRCCRATTHCFEGPLAGRVKSAGQAVLGCEIRIFDADDNEVPRGTVGEICGRGADGHAGLLEAAGADRAHLAQRLAAHRRRRLMDDEGFVFSSIA